MEREGTFGIRGMSPYFQVGQHMHSLIVLQAISLFFASLPNLFEFTLNSGVPYNSESLNNSTAVYTFSMQDIDSLYAYILFFFLGMPFQTRKLVDFQYWALVLHLHKFGYFYMPEGRALVLAISKYINEGRYSTNPTGPVLAPRNTDILDLLSSTTLVELTPEMTHTMLARAFTIAKGKSSYQVWVYDGGLLFKGSPFATYADAHEAIGVGRTSRAIGRNIDTNKQYRGRYTFYSNSK